MRAISFSRAGLPVIVASVLAAGIGVLLASAAPAVAAVAAVAAGPAVVHAQPAAAFSFSRYQGSDRYATAAAIAEGAFPSGSASVVIASGSSFPDALAASYLAGYIAGPVLLTSPTSLSSATSAALTKLKATKVYLVGGTAAVSASVQAQIAALAAAGGGTISVTRVSGSSRYDTDEAIATLPPVSHVGNVDGEKTAIVASGANFPDALAGSTLAYSDHLPILLTDPDTLSAQVTASITHLGVVHVLVLGGTSAISAAVATGLQAAGVSVTRISGADRTATAAAVASFAINNASFTSTRVAIARGDQAGGGVDALALGALAGSKHEALLLTASPTDPGPGTTAWLHTNGSKLTGGDAAGGPSALTDTLLEQLITVG